MLVYINENRTVTGYNTCFTRDEAQRYVNGRTAFWINEEEIPECEKGYEVYLDTDGTLKARVKDEKKVLPTTEDLLNNQYTMMMAIADLYEAISAGAEEGGTE